MECTKLTNWHVCWKRINIFSRLDLDGGYTVNIYPLYVRVSYQLKKGDPHIGDMKIILSLSILSTTTKARMIQPSKIPCRGNHQS